MLARLRLSLVPGALAGLLAASSAHAAVDDSALQVRGQARACYLGFIHLYDAEYLSDAQGARCVRVAYLREFSAEDLDRATRRVFRIRHGDAVTERFGDWLEQVGEAYRPVEVGDRYTYCVSGDHGTLLRDGQTAVQISDGEFARRFMQIWVHREQLGARPDWAFTQC